MRTSVCISGQVALLILIHDVRKVPTVRMVESNTDAIELEIDEEYLPQLKEVLTHWQQQYRLELEDEYVLKLVMRDVNNFASILKTDKGLQVKCKGACFAGCPKIKIHNDGRLETIYQHSFKANSKIIVGEALLKKLLFNIPVEDTINKCNDLECFQIVGHVGSTYEKCILRTPEGDIELQRNNRIYAGKKPSGAILKVKPDGREDSLANQPTNPIIDNGNKCSIEDIDKMWYIKLAKQWVNDFKGVTRLENMKKDELLELAKQKGIEVDKKVKKDELVKILDEFEEKCDKQGIKHPEKCDEREMCTMNIYEKLNQIKKEIREHDFIMDQVMPGNLGEKEYASIGQYYSILQEKCLKHKVFFQWNVVNMPYDIKENIFKPTTGKPSHVATVKCIAVFVNTEKKDEIVTIDTMASGSDICDKSVSGASTLAFRNFFDKNFTPKYMNTVEEINTNEEEQTEQPKIPTYIPETKKEEIKKEVVATPQKDSSDDDDAKRIITNIMKVRELSGNDTWGTQTLDSLSKGEYTSADILEIDLKVQAKLESLGAE